MSLAWRAEKNRSPLKTRVPPVLEKLKLSEDMMLNVLRKEEGASREMPLSMGQEKGDMSLSLESGKVTWLLRNQHSVSPHRGGRTGKGWLPGTPEEAGPEQGFPSLGKVPLPWVGHKSRDYRIL